MRQAKTDWDVHHVRSRPGLKTWLSAAVIGVSTTFLMVFASGASHAKNVIFFLGDGMGISTVTAARIFAGQTAGATGEEYDLAFDQFPHLALIKTYNTDAPVLAPSPRSLPVKKPASEFLV